METYSVLRQFADSWGMLAMFLGFIGIVVYVMLGRRARHRDAAESIFRNEDAPKDDTQPGDADGGDDATNNEAR